MALRSRSIALDHNPITTPHRAMITPQAPRKGREKMAPISFACSGGGIPLSPSLLSRLYCRYRLRFMGHLSQCSCAVF